MKSKMESTSNPNLSGRGRSRRSRLRPRGFDRFESSPGEGDEIYQTALGTSCLAALGLPSGGMTGDGYDRRSQRRTRKVQASTVASALLALCALIVLSGDILRFPTMVSSISRRLLADDTSSSELIPVSGVRTATFFLPVEPHLKFNNKMNSHFTLDHYSQGLANTCQFLTKLDHPAYVLGDQAFIQSRAATCSDLAAEESFRYAMEDLKHEEAAAMVQRHMCRRKFATDKHDARRILKEHGEVWIYLFLFVDVWFDIVCADMLMLMDLAWGCMYGPNVFYFCNM